MKKVLHDIENELHSIVNGLNITTDDKIHIKNEISKLVRSVDDKKAKDISCIVKRNITSRSSTKAILLILALLAAYSAVHIEKKEEKKEIKQKTAAPSAKKLEAKIVTPKKQELLDENVIFDRYGVVAVQRILNKNGFDLVVDGIAGNKTLAALKNAGIANIDAIMSERLRNNCNLEYINIARGEIGTRETKGSENNPDVMKYHESVSSWLTNDEISWCASFVNWTMETAGYTTVNSARSSDWAKFGKEVDEPVYGAIAIMHRYNKEGKLIGGHVTFIIAEDNKYLYGLGGNQSDEVRVSKFKKDSFYKFVVPLDYRDEYLLAKPTIADACTIGD